MKTKKERISHYRTQEAISRSKTYQVSEDKYDMLQTRSNDWFNIVGYLEATLDLLDEDDPRYEFASELMEKILG